jgi:hypothetical protein
MNCRENCYWTLALVLLIHAGLWLNSIAGIIRYSKKHAAFKADSVAKVLIVS